MTDDLDLAALKRRAEAAEAALATRTSVALRLDGSLTAALVRIGVLEDALRRLHYAVGLETFYVSTPEIEDAKAAARAALATPAAGETP